jgi:hypothetical protein
MLTIVGAGMAGLLCGQMLARRKPEIIEAQEKLPNNHSAVLRFRSTVVGDVLGLPFKKVQVAKSYLPWRNPVADALSYAHKCTGVSRTDRSIRDGTEMVDRYIAPPDLINQMAEGLDIKYSQPWSLDKRHYAPIISTLPMPILMRLLDYPRRKEVQFKQIAGFNLRSQINDLDAYATLYIPNPAYSFNRVSITGNEIIAEYAWPFHSRDEVFKLMDEELDTGKEGSAVLELLGLGYQNGNHNIVYTKSPKFKFQQYAKVVPIDDDIRKDFIHWATDKHNVYSLGRFATWRPGVLLDDLVKDVRLIEKWLGASGSYERAQHRGEAQ